MNFIMATKNQVATLAHTSQYGSNPGSFLKGFMIVRLCWYIFLDGSMCATAGNFLYLLVIIIIKIINKLV